MKKAVIILSVFALIVDSCGQTTKKQPEKTNSVFMSDTIFINQDWDIDNLKFGQSNIDDFETFRKNRQITFKESRQNRHGSGAILDSLENIVGMTVIWNSSIYFENDSLGLKFYFLAVWAENYFARPDEVLQGATFEKYDKLQFYNGINLQSSYKDVIKAFGNPEKEWQKDELQQQQTVLFYSFEKVRIHFTFQNNSLFRIEIRKD
ncbi:MAG: hypothetical protein FWE63_00535 [Bacteroidales bacterium]|nr:hypothetical protein [Bacteroidales bacterium]